MALGVSGTNVTIVVTDLDLQPRPRPAARRRCGPGGCGPTAGAASAGRRRRRRACRGSRRRPRRSCRRPAPGRRRRPGPWSTASRRTSASGRSPGSRRLVDVGRHDVERHPELGQQLAPARRRRGQHQPVQRRTLSRRRRRRDRRPGRAQRIVRVTASPAARSDGGLGDRQPRQAQRPAGPARQQRRRRRRRSAGTPGGGRRAAAGWRRGSGPPPRAAGVPCAARAGRPRAWRRTSATVRRDVVGAERQGDAAALGDVLVGLGRRQRLGAVALVRPQEADDLGQVHPRQQVRVGRRVRPAVRAPMPRPAGARPARRRSPAGRRRPSRTSSRRGSGWCGPAGPTGRRGSRSARSTPAIASGCSDCSSSALSPPMNIDASPWTRVIGLPGANHGSASGRRSRSRTSAPSGPAMRSKMAPPIDRRTPATTSSIAGRIVQSP